MTTVYGMSSPGANGRMGVPRGHSHEVKVSTDIQGSLESPSPDNRTDFYYGKETRWQELSWSLENAQYAQAACLQHAGTQPALSLGCQLWEWALPREQQPEQSGAGLCTAEPSLGVDSQWNLLFVPCWAQRGQSPAEELGKHKGLSTSTL